MVCRAFLIKDAAYTLHRIRAATTQDQTLLIYPDMNSPLAGGGSMHTRNNKKALPRRHHNHHVSTLPIHQASLNPWP